MRYLLILLGACVTLACTSCVSLDLTKIVVSPTIDKLAAISLANGAVLKCGLPLDRTYRTKVKSSVYAAKGAPPYPAFCVSYYKKPSHSHIYVVYVRKTDGYISDVADFTKTYLIEPK